MFAGRVMIEEKPLHQWLSREAIAFRLVQREPHIAVEESLPKCRDDLIHRCGRGNPAVGQAGQPLASPSHGGIQGRTVTLVSSAGETVGHVYWYKWVGQAYNFPRGGGFDGGADGLQGWFGLGAQ